MIRMTIAIITLLVAVPALAQPTLDELLDLEPAPQEREPAPPAPRQQDAPAEVPIDQPVERRLTGEQAADAFKQALQQMDEVAQRLAAAQDAGLETQRLQESVLEKLAMVIEAAQQMSGGSSSQQQQGQPQQQDTGSEQNQQQGQAQAQASAGENRGETTNPPSPAAGEQAGAIAEERREWGNLPPRIRDELIQASNERFSPVYKTLTEAYYQRLAEEGR